MKIDVIFTGTECSIDNVLHKNAVVIDVLRATSVIVTALNNGAKKVVTFKTIEEVLEYAKSGGAPKITGGERNANKIHGFDCGNSPLEYTKDVVFGKEVVLTTSNGTKAIENAKDADCLYIGALINYKAVCRRLLMENKDIVLVCAGTKGLFSTDDCLCAGVFIDYLERERKVDLTDASRFLMDFYRTSCKDMNILMKDAAHYNKLKESGYREDIEYCLMDSIINIVPFYRDGYIII